MSITMLAPTGVLLASGGGEGFEPPGPQDFWQPLIGSGTWAFTRPMLLWIISVVALSWWFIATTRKAAIVPGKGQFLTEMFYNTTRNGIARDMIGSKEFLKYVPFLFSLFAILLVNNLFGVIPPFQFPTISRIGFPIALTAIVYVIYHYIGIKKHGLRGYFGSFVPSGLPAWIVPMVLVLETFSFFVTRPLTLAMRIFGNMLAGHMLLLVFITGGEYMLLHGGIGLKVISVPTFLLAFIMTVFEALIEVVQAYIFTLLAASYIATSLADEH
ncbi:F0F1 ATP synthase subunit A [Segeticoccus rhizosphaerae]|uniref:F0F1 ATP synthase subunit A n=1 Tax=Segeticoccus rhizosphaerae TaxID=1104777 RepID=UPI001EE46153|nr:MULTISPECIES: F0F1 ATP synthase subunit A [Intrasporangiaceae]